MLGCLNSSWHAWPICRLGSELSAKADFSKCCSERSLGLATPPSNKVGILHHRPASASGNAVDANCPKSNARCGPKFSTASGRNIHRSPGQTTTASHPLVFSDKLLARIRHGIVIHCAPLSEAPYSFGGNRLPCAHWPLASGLWSVWF